MATPTKSPRAHEGPRYANPTSKPIRGTPSVGERSDVQRFTWKLFFVLVLCVFALAIVFSMVAHHG